MSNKPVPMLVVHDKLPIIFFFYKVMWERMLNGDSKFIISTINKYKPLTEQLITTLRMWGWELEALPENPYKEIREGSDTNLIYYKYSLELNPTVEAIMKEVVKDTKSRNILMYHLDNLETEMKENNEFLMKVVRDKEFNKQVNVLIELVKTIQAGKKDASVPATN